MEESELDEWFSQMREKLEDQFYAQAVKDSVAAKEHFDHEYKKLILVFQHKQAHIYESRVRAAAVLSPIRRIREQLKLFFQPILAYPKRVMQRIKAWFFERKMQRILKDKSDLYH